MKIQLRQVRTTVLVLNVLLDMEFPASWSWKILELADDLEPVVKRINKVREKYNKKDQGLSDEELEKNHPDYSDLMDEEIELKSLPIPLSVMGDREVPPRLFLIARWMFIDDLKKGP